MKRMSAEKWINLIVIALILTFIWTRSAKSIEASHMESAGFMENLVIPLEKALFGKEIVSEEIIRKCAHVFEFAMLGAALFVFVKKIWMTLGLGMAAAVIDETIQFFYERGSMVTDIWIDTLGCLLGCMIVMSILKFSSKNK